MELEVESPENHAPHTLQGVFEMPADGFAKVKNRYFRNIFLIVLLMLGVFFVMSRINDDPWLMVVGLVVVPPMMLVMAQKNLKRLRTIYHGISLTLTEGQAVLRKPLTPDLCIDLNRPFKGYWNHTGLSLEQEGKALVVSSGLADFQEITAYLSTRFPDTMQQTNPTRVITSGLLIALLIVGGYIGLTVAHVLLHQRLVTAVLGPILLIAPFLGVRWMERIGIYPKDHVQKFKFMAGFIAFLQVGYIVVALTPA